MFSNFEKLLGQFADTLAQKHAVDQHVKASYQKVIKKGEDCQQAQAKELDAMRRLGQHQTQATVFQTRLKEWELTRTEVYKLRMEQYSQSRPFSPGDPYS